jgi:hypothetical protein
MHPYKNTYKVPAAPTLDEVVPVPPENYDFNYVFPVVLLRTDRVELRPFVVCRPSLYMLR